MNQEIEDESSERVDPHPRRRRTARHRHVDWGVILGLAVIAVMYAVVDKYFGGLW